MLFYEEPSIVVPLHKSHAIHEFLIKVYKPQITLPYSPDHRTENLVSDLILNKSH
jgi:hypothetical protein